MGCDGDGPRAFLVGGTFRLNAELLRDVNGNHVQFINIYILFNPGYFATIPTPFVVVRRDILRNLSKAL